MTSDRRSRPQALGRWIRPRFLPALLIAFGLAVAGLIAYRSQQPQPPTATEAVFLVLASSALNIAGAALFGRIGHADPSHARSAVRRLLATGRVLATCLQQLDDGLSSGDSDSLTSKTHRVHGQLFTAQFHVRDALEDWKDVHPEALEEVLETEYPRDIPSLGKHSL